MNENYNNAHTNHSDNHNNRQRKIFTFNFVSNGFHKTTYSSVKVDCFKYGLIIIFVIISGV